MIALAVIVLIAGTLILFRSQGLESAPISTRPADGLVEFVAAAGVRVEANSSFPEVGRFGGFLDAGPHPSVPIKPFRAAPSLMGEVALWSIFIGRDGKNWSQVEIVDAIRATERAGLWIESEASRHEASVNVRVVATYFEGLDPLEHDVEVGFQQNGREMGPHEGNAEVQAIASASRVAQLHGFTDLIDLVQKVQSRVPADRHAWILHVRREGQSFAVVPADSPIPGLSLAYCYVRETSFSGVLGRFGLVDAVTIAHELLHLFGASDKYGVPLSEFPPGSVGPKDVMRLNYERLSQLRVDPLTALEVGWPQGTLLKKRPRPASSR